MTNKIMELAKEVAKNVTVTKGDCSMDCCNCPFCIFDTCMATEITLRLREIENEKGE
jgi:glutaredoxin